VGPPDTVTRALAPYRDAGATDIVLSPLDRGERVALEAIAQVAAGA
jgi:hypothetical protein